MRVFDLLTGSSSQVLVHIVQKIITITQVKTICEEQQHPHGSEKKLVSRLAFRIASDSFQTSFQASFQTSFQTCFCLKQQKKSAKELFNYEEACLLSNFSLFCLHTLSACVTLHPPPLPLSLSEIWHTHTLESSSIALSLSHSLSVSLSAAKLGQKPFEDTTVKQTDRQT